MQLKESADIFVMGFVLSVIGGGLSAGGTYGSFTYNLDRNLYSQGGASAIYSQGSSDNGYGVLISLGVVVALVGLVQMGMGTYRALRRIDAIPVPVLAAPVTPLPVVPEPEPEPEPVVETVVMPNPPKPYFRPATPRHLIYDGPGIEQPPVE